MREEVNGREGSIFGKSSIKVKQRKIEKGWKGGLKVKQIIWSFENNKG